MTNSEINKISQCKKFCVVTTGRSGSTSFMKAFEKFDDIAVPNKNLVCPDNELLNFRRIKEHKKSMSKLVNNSIKSREELIKYFFDYNNAFSYVGFKLLPPFEKYTKFFQREDIKFIYLKRDDLPSTVASSFFAIKYKTWKRSGEKHNVKERIKGFDKLLVRKITREHYRSKEILDTIPTAIQIRFEDLCQPDFLNTELDGFFNRHIKLDNPKPPLSGAEYIDNWEWFKQYVKRWYF